MATCQKTNIQMFHNKSLLLKAFFYKTSIGDKWKHYCLAYQKSRGPNFKDSISFFQTIDHNIQIVEMAIQL